MQDLSRDLLPDPISAMVPTSQSAGNRAFLNDAMTAPGGTPAGGLPGEEHVESVPVVDDIVYDPKGKVHVVNDQGGHQIPDSNTDRSTLFTQDDGSGWRRPQSGTA